MDLSTDEIVYDYIKSMIGLPYKWGGDDPMGGFDCSGFVIEILQAYGVIPHRFDTTAKGLWRRFTGTRHGRPAEMPRFGVLAFYGQSKNKVTHVAFCLNKTLIVEAGGGTSRTDGHEAASRDNAFIRIRPREYRKDLVGLALPNY